MSRQSDASTEVLARLAGRKRRGRWGVGTAAAYVRQMEPYAEDKQAFAEALKRAEAQPVYTEEDLLIEGHRLKAADDPDPSKPLMVFKATITTTRMDRDRDILESKGARPDMAGPLLFNHVYDSVIGKPLKAVAHNSKRYAEQLAIVNSPDPNSPLGLLARDVATLIDFGALRRMSHGFLPDENADPDDPAYEPILDKEGEFLGWHFYRYEIMERSVVSVASNVDAVITAHSQAKLFSPMVKGWASKMYDERPVVVQGADLAEKTADDDDDDEESDVPAKNPDKQDDGGAVAEPELTPLLDDERSGGTYAVPRKEADEVPVADEATKFRKDVLHTWICGSCHANGQAKGIPVACPECGASWKTVPPNPSNGGGEAVEGDWKKPTLSDFTDKQWDDLTASEKSSIRKYFAWDAGGGTFGDLSLPHHFPPGHANAGKASLNGVNNAKARAGQVSGLSGDDLDKVVAHLTAHQPKQSRAEQIAQGIRELDDSKSMFLGRHVDDFSSGAVRKARDLVFEDLRGEIVCARDENDNPVIRTLDDLADWYLKCMNLLSPNEPKDADGETKVTCFPGEGGACTVKETMGDYSVACTAPTTDEALRLFAELQKIQEDQKHTRVVTLGGPEFKPVPVGSVDDTAEGEPAEPAAPTKETSEGDGGRQGSLGFLRRLGGKTRR